MTAAKKHELLGQLDDCSVRVGLCADALCCMHDALETTRGDILQGGVMLIREALQHEHDALEAFYSVLRDALNEDLTP